MGGQRERERKTRHACGDGMCGGVSIKVWLVLFSHAHMNIRAGIFFPVSACMIIFSFGHCIHS